jgi:hypothetical protein
MRRHQNSICAASKVFSLCPAVVIPMILVVMATCAGCSRPPASRKEAIEAVLNRIDPEMASNLVREAATCISGMPPAQRSKGPSYLPLHEHIPVASNLGSVVWVEIAGPSATCMVVVVPVGLAGRQPSEVIVEVKPGGGFASDTNAINLSDEIRLYAVDRSRGDR